MDLAGLWGSHLGREVIRDCNLLQMELGPGRFGPLRRAVRRIAPNRRGKEGVAWGRLAAHVSRLSATWKISVLHRVNAILQGVDLLSATVSRGDKETTTSFPATTARSLMKESGRP